MIQAKTHAPAGSTKALALGLLLAALLNASMMLATSKSVHAATTFTVTTTSDSGAGSLRQAILDANATPGADTINFNIGGTAPVKTIRPASELPIITEPVTIDGYTQPGSSPNTLQQGTNAVLKIELDGTNAGENAIGLRTDDAAPLSVVRGLVINRFGDTGVRIGDGGNRVEGNFIGTDATGTLDLGNGGSGVLVLGGANTIGGSAPSQRNVISGNDGSGVSTQGANETDNLVLGNLIGTKKDGKGNLGNAENGVLVVDSALNVIGNDFGGANTIAFNGGDGVRIAESVFEATENLVFGNSIFSNAGLGIDLAGGTENTAGATKNDPRDADTGPNDLQNKPVLTSATTSGGTTTVKGKLNTIPNEAFELHFYSSPSGNEGKKFIGKKDVTTDSNGDATFTFTPGGAVAAGQMVTATATHDPELGGSPTSEFSAPRTVVAR